MMRIAVIDQDGPMADQTRAYTEYKVFSSLAPYARRIDHVEVILARPTTDVNGAETACTVMVALVASGCERVRVCASRTYSAIDCAAVQIAQVMKSRAAQPLPGLRSTLAEHAR